MNLITQRTVVHTWRYCSKSGIWKCLVAIAGGLECPKGDEVTPWGLGQVHFFSLPGFVLQWFAFMFALLKAVAPSSRGSALRASLSEVSLRILLHMF